MRRHGARLDGCLATATDAEPSVERSIDGVLVHIEDGQTTLHDIVLRCVRHEAGAAGLHVYAFRRSRASFLRGRTFGEGVDGKGGEREEGCK